MLTVSILKERLMKKATKRTSNVSEIFSLFDSCTVDYIILELGKIVCHDEVIENTRTCENSSQLNCKST